MELNEKLNFVGIGAHHFDVIKACGGTFAKYAQKGHKVWNVIMGSMDKEISEERSRIYEEEAINAWKVIGEGGVRPVGRYHLDQLGTMENNWEAILKLVETLRELHADVVFTHFPEDRPIHNSVGRMATKAVTFASSQGIKTEHPPHRIRCLLYYQSTTGMFPHIAEMFRPDVYIDVSDVEEIKEKALAQIKSHVILDVLRDRRFVQDRYYGLLSRCNYAEGFKLERKVGLKLAFDELPFNWIATPKERAHYASTLP